MHKDEIKGAGNDAKGKIKEAAGKALGDERLQAEGAGDQAKGNLQKAAGSLKEGVRDILKN